MGPELQSLAECQWGVGGAKMREGVGLEEEVGKPGQVGRFELAGQGPQLKGATRLGPWGWGRNGEGRVWVPHRGQGWRRRSRARGHGERHGTQAGFLNWEK